MRINKQQSGVTLIELTVVLLILVALAGLAVPYISGTGSAAMCKATDVTMQNVKKVIMERYYLDTLGYFPKDTKSITADYNLKYLFTIPNGWTPFDPATQTGWRQGGYLQNGITLTNGENYSKANLHASFKDLASAPNNHVHVDLADGDSVVLDGWGRPLILQKSPSGFFRLVSAGEGMGLGLSDASIDTKITDNNRQADDRILYLDTTTSAADVNPPCDQQ